MRTARPVLALLLLVLGIGCATQPKVAFDAHERFERFRTWNWRVTDAARVDAPQESAIALASALSQAIQEAMEARGFVRDPIAPDFTLTFHLSLQPRIEMVAVPRAPYLLSSYGSSGAFLIEGTDVEARSFEDLQLSIDVGLRNGPSVWKGAVRERVEKGQSPDLERAVEDLLKRLPPPSAAPEPKLEPDRLARVMQPEN